MISFEGEEDKIAEIDPKEIKVSKREDDSIISYGLIRDNDEQLTCKQEEIMHSYNKLIDECDKKPVKCTSCDRMLSDNWSLLKHIQEHTNIQDDVLQCKICGMVFTSVKTLEDHNVIHRNQQASYQHVKEINDNLVITGS